MPKIPNWRKTKSIYHTFKWTNTKTNEEVSIISPADKPTWFVETPDYLLAFNTKKTAYNTAVDWMRKHPRGK